MPVENGEISGFVKMFYGILITLAVCGGLYAIINGLVAGDNSTFGTLLEDTVLGKIQTKITTTTGTLLGEGDGQ